MRILKHGFALDNQAKRYALMIINHEINIETAKRAWKDKYFLVEYYLSKYSERDAFKESIKRFRIAATHKTINIYLEIMRKQDIELVQALKERDTDKATEVIEQTLETVGEMIEDVSKKDPEMNRLTAEIDKIKLRIDIIKGELEKLTNDPNHSMNDFLNKMNEMQSLIKRDEELRNKRVARLNELLKEHK